MRRDWLAPEWEQPRIALLENLSQAEEPVVTSVETEICVSQGRVEEIDQ